MELYITRTSQCFGSKEDFNRVGIELGMADPLIPTVDLSPFFREDDEDGKRKAMDVITKACSEYGFFLIVNHGVPENLLQRVLELSMISSSIQLKRNSKVVQLLMHLFLQDTTRSPNTRLTRVSIY